MIEDLFNDIVGLEPDPMNTLSQIEGSDEELRAKVAEILGPGAYKMSMADIRNFLLSL